MQELLGPPAGEAPRWKRIAPYQKTAIQICAAKVLHTCWMCATQAGRVGV